MYWLAYDYQHPTILQFGCQEQSEDNRGALFSFSSSQSSGTRTIRQLAQYGKPRLGPLLILGRRLKHFGHIFSRGGFINRPPIENENLDAPLNRIDFFRA